MRGVIAAHGREVVPSFRRRTLTAWHHAAHDDRVLAKTARRHALVAGPARTSHQLQDLVAAAAKNSCRSRREPRGQLGRKAKLAPYGDVRVATASAPDTARGEGRSALVEASLIAPSMPSRLSSRSLARLVGLESADVRLTTRSTLRRGAPRVPRGARERASTRAEWATRGRSARRQAGVALWP